MTYFDACDSLDDLKAAYKRLALRYHPDCGGDLRTMQEAAARSSGARGDFRIRKGRAYAGA